MYLRFNTRYSTGKKVDSVVDGEFKAFRNTRFPFLRVTLQGVVKVRKTSGRRISEILVLPR